MSIKTVTEVDKQEELLKRYEEQAEAIAKSLRRYLKVGFIIGLLLAAVGELWSHDLSSQTDLHNALKGILGLHIRQVDIYFFVSVIMKELGVGILVATIVGLAFERLPHVRELVVRQFRLEAQIGTLELSTIAMKEVRNEMRAAVQQMNRNFIEDADQLGNELLDSLFPGEKDEESKFKQSTKELIKQARRLSSVETGNNQKKLEFVAWLMERTVLKMTKSLAGLQHSVSKSEPSHFYPYSLPDSRDVASHFLAACFDSLKDGDSYDSISNVLFWEDRLMEDFLERMRAKQGHSRSVKARRLFNVTNFEREVKLQTEKFSDAKKIIEAHLDEAARSQGLYEIRFFGEAVKNKKYIKTRLKENDYPYLEQFPLVYYGIFHHRGDDRKILFIADDPKLSRMSMGYCESENPGSDLFEELWMLCKDVPNPFQGDSFSQNWSDTNS